MNNNMLVNDHQVIVFNNYGNNTDTVVWQKVNCKFLFRNILSKTLIIINIVEARKNRTTNRLYCFQLARA